MGVLNGHLYNLGITPYTRCCRGIFLAAGEEGTITTAEPGCPYSPNPRSDYLTLIQQLSSRSCNIAWFWSGKSIINDIHEGIIAVPFKVIFCGGGRSGWCSNACPGNRSCPCVMTPCEL